MLFVIKLFAEEESELHLHEHYLMQQATHLAVLACHYGCLCCKLRQSCHWSVQKQFETCFACHIMCLAFSSHCIYLRNEKRGSHLQCHRVLGCDSV